MPSSGVPRATYYRRVAAGTLLPGAGLLGTRWRILGWFLVVVALASGIVVAFRLLQGGLVRTALEAAVRPELLQAVAVAIGVGAVLWVGSIVLTAEHWWPAKRQGRWVRAGFALLACVVIAAPAALAVRYLGVQSTVIDEVFSADGRGGGAAYADATAPDPWADVPRVNTLLIGSDAGKDRWGTRTDSLMVVSTDTKTGETLLIGIPRNLERVPFPESNPLHALYPNGYDCGDECLMNGIWTLAESRPDLFPGVENPGRQSTVDVVGAITGLEIDQSVVINLKGFRALVDAMGGVDVNVQERVCVECRTGTWAGSSSPATRRSGSSRACSTSTAGGPCGTPARGRAATTSAGCGGSAASPVRSSSRPTRSRCCAATPSSPRSSRTTSASTSRRPSSRPGSSSCCASRRATRSGRCPLTSKVVEPGNPDFAKIRSLVKKALKPRPAATASASASATPSPTETPSEDTSGTPSPTPTPDDAAAADLSATC